MAVTDITPVQLVRDTASADLPDASGTSIAAGVDGFNILATVGYARNVVVRVTEAGATAGTVTFTAGAKPPSIRAGLGDLVVSFAASDVKMISLEQGRFLQADGTIDGVCGGTSVDDFKMAVFLLPRDI
jgi:hypothetical protein